jgi:predicted ester cyclase
MAIDQHKEAVRRMLEAFNSGDEKPVDEVAHEQLVDQTPFPGTGPDRNGLKTQIKAVRRAFPDAKFSIDRMVAEGDTVAFRWRMEGTHRGPLFGHAATGKPFVHFGNDFVTFKDGKIVEHLSADNIGELLSTLGIERPQPK